MPALHLIQNQNDPKLLPKPEKPGSDQWVSGYWSLSEATVRSLIGGQVYFHKAQVKPAFLGGELLAYRLAEEPPYAGRIILVFRPNPEAKGVITSRDGWAMEKKIISDQDSIMNPYRFTVGTNYENEKGTFKVLVIKGDSMLSAWDSGERITTSIAMQERILIRMEKEANATANCKGTPSPVWMGRTFSGLLAGDFKDEVDGTHWRSREQLGGAVTRQLASPVPFNSWSIYRRPEIHWASISRYRSDDAWVQSKFFIRLQEKIGLYGFYIERSKDPTESRMDWLNLMNWLAVDDKLNWLHQLLEETGMWIFDPYPELELAFNRSIRPQGEGWIVEHPDLSTQVVAKAELANHLTEIDDSAGLNLVIGFRRPKEEFLAQGVNVAIEIAECFNHLLPIYAKRTPAQESKA